MTPRLRARGGRGPAAGWLLALALSAACARPVRVPTAQPRPPPARPEPPAAPRLTLAPGSYGAEPAAALAPEEAEALDLVRRRAVPGSPAPRTSGALVAAARLLAQRAAAGAAEPLDRGAVRDAQARALSYDPAPSAYLARAGRDQLGETLARALGTVSATHAGAGVAQAGDGLAVVVLTTQRKARLDPFPRELPQGGQAVLSGSLAAGLRSPKVFLTLPSGAVQEAAVSGGGAFRAPLRFPDRGRYLVEVVAEGQGGPTVAALMAVAAGGADVEVRSAGAPEDDPDDPARAEARVLAALNDLRAGRGLAPLSPSPQLTEVARRHSAAMGAAGQVAHQLPGSPGPADRLSRAGIAYRRVLENVAAARTALGAHEAAAESPAHLRNMLEPAVSQVGIGVVRDQLASGDPRTYLTELFVEPAPDDRESRLTLDAQVREALWRERARLHLPPLTADGALDELARSGAIELQRRDARDLPDAAGRALALRRGLAAADAFVASTPEEAGRSQNLGDPRFRRVGVGVVKGTSRRFGAGRLFIAVIYTD